MAESLPFIKLADREELVRSGGHIVDTSDLQPSGGNVLKLRRQINC